MYDTVEIPYIDYNNNLLEIVPKYLPKIINNGVDNYGEYFTGKMDNLYVIIRENKIKIKNSIGKYYFGTNFETLTRQQTKEAICKISDTLHLPIERAIINRMDFGGNLITDYTPELYYKYLGQAQYYKRLEQPTGIYYQNNKRQLVIYDKIKEQKSKREIIPDKYKNKNVLRYELRYLKNPAKQLKQKEIKVKDLYDPEFYKKLKQYWKDGYFKIQKLRKEILKMNAPKNIKEFEKNLLAIIAGTSQQDILNKITEWQEMGLIDRKKAYKLRNRTKSYSKIETGNGENYYILELNQKVLEAAKSN